MKRSKWKRPCVDPTLLNKIYGKNLTNEIKTKSRNSEILPNFVGKSFNIHTGNNFVTILITTEMIGHKLGEFAFTRKQFIFKNK